MSQQLLKRRLIFGPIMAAVAVYGITAMSKDMGWEGAAVPSIVVGVLASFGVAWYLVRSERALATRPPAQTKVGLIVGALVIGTLLVRLGPSALIYAVLVAGVALSLGGVISSVYELVRGTYADAGRQQNQR